MLQIFERETRKEKNLEAAKKLAELKSKVARENPGNKNFETKKIEILKKCEDEFYALIGKTDQEDIDQLKEEDVPKTEKKIEKDSKPETIPEQPIQSQKSAAGLELQSEEKKEDPQEDEKKLEKKVSEKQVSDMQESDRKASLNNASSNKELEIKEEDKPPSARQKKL